MKKSYILVLLALLPLWTMGKGILIKNVVIFDGKSPETITGNIWIAENKIQKISAEPINAGEDVEVIDGMENSCARIVDAHWHAYLAANTWSV